MQAVVALFAPADMIVDVQHDGAEPGTVSALMGFAYQDPALRSFRRGLTTLRTGSIVTPHR